MKKITKKLLINSLNESLQSNLYSEELKFLQKADFVKEAYHSKNELIINEAILKSISIAAPYDGFILLFSLTPAEKALKIIERLNDYLENELYFVPDPNRVLTHIFNNLEV